MQPNRIVFVDSWKRGFPQFIQPVVQALSESDPNLRFSLLHWEGAKTGTYTGHQEINGVNMIDLSARQILTMRSVLKSLNPRVVLFLHTTYLFDRIILAACRDLGIRTILVQLMLWTVDRSESESASNISRSAPGLKRKMGEYGKYVALYLLDAVVHRGWTGLNNGLKIVSAIIRDSAAVYKFPQASPDIQCDQYLVFGPRFRDFVKAHWDYDDNKIVVTGSPWMDRLVERQVGKDSTGPELWLYIAQPLVEDGLVQRSDFEDFLISMGETAHESHARLVVKLHPRSTSSLYACLDAWHVQVTADNLEPLILKADLVLGHTSTALLDALAFGKSGLVLDCFSDLHVPLMFREFPNAPVLTKMQLTSLEKARKAMTRGDDTGAWLRKPDGQAMQRIVNQILTNPQCSNGPERERRGGAVC